MLGPGIAKALKEKGVGNGEATSIGLKKAADRWTAGYLLLAELDFDSK